MTSVFEQELVVVTGKGGVGKTTIATAIGLLAAERGLRTIVVEVGEQGRVPELFEIEETPGTETQLQDSLWSISIDLDTALMEWLQALGGRVSGRVLGSSSTFHYFAAAAPGAKEMVSMVKIWELTQKKRWRGHPAGYDLVVLDAPATGHALGMLDSPRTFGAIARVGPVHTQAERVRTLLEDPARSSYLAVAQGTEMAISETLELADKLHSLLGRDLDAVIANGLLPQRFTAPELQRLQGLGNANDGVASSAAAAAQSVHERARVQRNQIARLRRRDFEVIAIPFRFDAELELAGVQEIAEQLARKL